MKHLKPESGKIDLINKFSIVKNEERKRWEFTPKEGVDSCSYFISFFEVKEEPDAWITLYLALKKANQPSRIDLEVAAMAKLVNGYIRFPEIEFDYLVKMLVDFAEDHANEIVKSKSL